QVVAVAAEERLERVRVPVHRSGEDRDVAPVLHLVLGVALLQLRGWPRVQDHRALHHEGVPALEPVAGEHELRADDRHSRPCITAIGGRGRRSPSERFRRLTYGRRGAYDPAPERPEMRWLAPYAVSFPLPRSPFSWC